MSGGFVRRSAALLGFPPGAGELIDQPTRRRLILSLGGSTILSVLDMLGVVAMLPLLQFVAGTSRESGALGVVNRILGRPNDAQLIAYLAGLVVLCFVGKDAFALVFRRWQLRFMANQEVALSVRMLDHYLRGPYAWQLVNNTGDKIWTVTSAVSAGYSGGLSAALAAVTEVMTISLILVSMLLVSPGITLAAVLYFSIATLLIQIFVRPRVLEASRRSTESGQATSQVTLQAFSSAKEIKLRNAAHVFVRDFKSAREVGAAAGARAGYLAELPKYLIEVLFVVGIGLLAVAVTSQGNSSDALIMLGVFAAAGTRIMPSAVRLLASVNTLRFAREPLSHLVRERRSLDMARTEETLRTTTVAVPWGDVEVKDVCFAYDTRPDRRVLDRATFTVQEGTSVAFVGPSGAGKSTAVDLLLGLLRPTSGVITAGGQDIHSNLPGWQSQLAVVPQDVVLFDDTLRANIAFELDHDPALMAEVIEKSQLADLVDALPRGLDTRVGERGTQFSGGQRQRVGIARALYRQPRMLFLDEATSALDNETERRFTETLRSLQGKISMVIVAHRLSTVRHCDQLVFLKDGSVEGTGTFEDLVDHNEEFARLVRLGRLDLEP